MPLRIAMWSGPRNISTALMRAWENRPDTAVIDEPFYAHYLLATRVPHPGAAEVIAHHETDARKVIDVLTGPVPGGAPIFYQKHMAHHLLPSIDRGWLDSVSNCFLIRDPREMLTSLAKTLAHPRIEDTGLPQQCELFDHLAQQAGTAPIVLDARDVLMDPESMLRRLCAALGVEFSPRMLHWPTGPRDTDGIWGPHWYESVWKSSGFESWRPKHDPLPATLHDLCARCMAFYERLHSHRLR